MNGGVRVGSVMRTWIGPAVAMSALLIQAGCSAPDASSGARDSDGDDGVAAAPEAFGEERGTAAGARATRETVDVAECLRVTGDASTDVSLEGWTGEYVLTMVEEVEGEVGRSVRGGLVLHAQLDALRQFAGAAGAAIPGVSAPLFGTTDVRVRGVGALPVGDLSSDDPEAPGVLVIESETSGGRSTMLRFGSDANRRDMSRFDGGFTVLNVLQVGDESFTGTWSSGSRRPEASGFFCVVLGS